MRNRILARSITSASLLIACALLSAASADADDGKTCNRIATKPLVDTVIDACTRAIVSGQYSPQEIVGFYASRAIAHAAKSQDDSASRDFAEAIRLDPQFAYADRTDPVAIGDGGFIVCCRAVVFDCRTRTAWKLADAQGSRYEQCIQTCASHFNNFRC